MLLYIHVPFCRARCSYCAFHSLPLSSCGQGAVQSWADGVFKEIAHWGDRLEHPPVSSIFFGGGTPSLLPEKIIAALLNRMDKAFNIEKGAEITLEANPDSAGEVGYLYEVFKAGVNRLSLGAQSLEDSMLKLMGRTHDARQLLNTFAQARQAGFVNISLDLIWGLPGQRPQAWMNTLREISRLKPEHLSCYGLTLEPDTTMQQLVESGRLQLPPEREQALMFINGAEFLEEFGYIHYEISNFARMGFQCRHNMGYWEGEEYLGFGPSGASTLSNSSMMRDSGVKAVSARASLASAFFAGAGIASSTEHLAESCCEPKWRWSNKSNLREWLDDIKCGRFAESAEEIDQSTASDEMLMLRLRTAKGLNIKDYNAISGRNLLAERRSIVDALHSKRLLRLKNGCLSLTSNGMLLSNSIIEALLP